MMEVCDTEQVSVSEIQNAVTGMYGTKKGLDNWRAE